MKLSSAVPAASAAAVMLMLLLLSAAATARGQALVPGVMIFGDSVVDAGNNNRLATLVRADFPPYGRDFPATHALTVRFCNGKLAMDYTGKRPAAPQLVGISMHRSGLFSISLLFNRLMHGQY